MTKTYKFYDEIPLLMQSYVLGVAEKKAIEDIPLEDINEYLRGLDEFNIEIAENRFEEYEDGWVL